MFNEIRIKIIHQKIEKIYLNYLLKENLSSWITERLLMKLINRNNCRFKKNKKFRMYRFD